MSVFITRGPLNPVDHRNVIIKRNEFKYIIDHIRMSDEYVFLCSPRSTGKATLLFQIQNCLQKCGYGVGYIYLDGQLDEPNFYKRICIRIFEEFKPVINHPGIDSAGYQNIISQEGFISFLKMLSAHSIVSKKLVIMLNIVHWNPQDISSFFSSLRHFFVKSRSPSSESLYRKITFILAGEFDLIRHIQREGISIHDFCKDFTLNDFSQEQCHGLAKNMKGCPPHCLKIISTAVYKWCSGHPYLTMQLFNLVNQNWQPEHVDNISKTIHQLVEAHILYDNDPILAHLRKNLEQDKKYCEQLFNLISKGPQKLIRFRGDLVSLGVIKRSDNGLLVIRNSIYETALIDYLELEGYEFSNRVFEETIKEPIMDKSIRILHLSDLHFDDPKERGKDDTENIHRYKHGPGKSALTLENYLVEDLSEELKVLPDFIVVSGDSTFQSAKGGFTEAEKFLLRLRALLSSKFNQVHPNYFRPPSDNEKNRWRLRKLGELPSSLFDIDRLLIIPGNHDICWKQTSVVLEEEHYNEFYLAIYGKNPNTYLTHICYDSASDVSIVGLNSARLEPEHNGLGYIEDAQITEARDCLRDKRREAGFSDDEDKTLRIAVFHHHLVQVVPIQYKEFKEGHFGVMMNAEHVICELIRNNFSMVLHGHQHMPFAGVEQRFYSKNEKDKSSQKLAVIGAGSVGIVHKELTEGYGRNHYNLITITNDKATVKWQCSGSPLGRFDTEACFDVPITRL